jgi:hypothetical protein
LGKKDDDDKGEEDNEDDEDNDAGFTTRGRSCRRAVSARKVGMRKEVGEVFWQVPLTHDGSDGKLEQCLFVSHRGASAFGIVKIDHPSFFPVQSPPL